MRPKHWIPPERDRPLDGELRIVRLASGRIRATKWRAYYSPPHDDWPGCYADARGDGVGDPSDPVVAVGVRP